MGERNRVSTDAQAHAYRRLAAAILARAAMDARGDNGHAAQARHWLVSSPWAGDLFDGLNLDRGVVLAWVRELPDQMQPALDL